jgi:predicted enzyme related to lactoylglutathione lyase
MSQRKRGAPTSAPATNGEAGVINSSGRFVWYELVTTDVAAAKTFYTAVMGWDTWDASVPGRPYTFFIAGNSPAGGAIELGEDARDTGTTPAWIGYVRVDDVDAAADRAARLGGIVHVPPTDVADISRFAIFSDPQAARLALIKWRKPGQQQPAEPGAPGRVGWNELLAADWEHAWAFYGALFGWQGADADTSEMGTYQLFAAGGEIIGGIATKPAATPAPLWLYYFNVTDLDAAAQRVQAAGGEILGVREVPGGSWVVHCADPQGAMFALEGLRGRNPVGYFARAASGDPSGRRGRRWSW